MASDWRKDLNIDNFADFGKATVADLYLAALSVTLDMKRTEKLCIDTLCRVYSMRKELAAREKYIEPSDAVIESLKFLVKGPEGERINNQIYKLGRDRLPDEALLNQIVSDAVNQARLETPRYAPTISGFKGMMSVLWLVGVIIGIVLVVWIDPLGRVSDSLLQNAATAAMVSPSPRLNVKLLCDVGFDAAEREKDNIKTGAVPVKIYLSGPDAELVGGVEVTRVGHPVPVYDFNGEYSAFVAEKSGQYRCEIMGEDGVSIVRFADADVSFGDLTLDRMYFTTPHDRPLEIDPDTIFEGIGAEVVISGRPSHGRFVPPKKDADDKTDADDTASPADAPDDTASGADIAASAADVSASGVSASNVSEADDVSGANASKSDDGEQESSGIQIYHPDKDFVGIDSFRATVKTADGRRVTCVVPVLVVNSAPYCNPYELYMVISHTPSRAGTAIGRVPGYDPDGDKLKYTLESAEECDVTLAPGGWFAVHISPDAKETAGFTFTVTDGLITMGPYEYEFRLHNTLVDLPDMRRNFYCYSGVDGFVDMDLPRYDDDGDTLLWSVVQPEPGNLTASGGRLKTENGRIKYCVNPQLTAALSETVVLSYTDGMAEPKTINFTCDILPNPGPVAAADNTTFVDVAVNKNIVCEVRLEPLCPFYTYEIVGVTSLEGTIAQNVGWKQMKFTFTFDSGYTSGTAIVTVKDTRSGQLATVEHRIVTS